MPNIPPPSVGKSLDMKSLLKTSLLSFDGLFVQSSVRSSFKMYQNEAVPQEAAYQAELERILRNWLPENVEIVSQHNVGGRRRCDIVVIPSQDDRIVVEIVVSETVNAIKEHFVRAREYADILDSKECWVLHITTDSLFNCPAPHPSLDVSVLNVYHDLKLSRFPIICENPIPDREAPYVDHLSLYRNEIADGRCIALTKAGKRCKNHCLKGGGQYCNIHAAKQT